MSELLPTQTVIRVAQSKGKVTDAALSRLDHLVVVSTGRPSGAALRALPDAAHLAALLRSRGPGAPAFVHTRLRNAHATGVTLAPLAKEDTGQPTAFRLLQLAGQVLADAMAAKPRRLGVIVTGMSAGTTRRLCEALVLAAAAHGFAMPDFRHHEKKSPPALRELVLLGLDEPLDTRRLLAEAEGANLARWLTALPPNRLTATAYRDIVAELAEHHDWSMRFLDVAALRRLNAGAFLAVAQGNATKDAGIVHLAYRPARAQRPDVALIGKGIIFDTGGTNLKPFKSMLDMHEDMCGSATALGTLLALTRLRAPVAADCWLAITENRLSPEAYKSRDVVTAADGTSIEVIHTDAEGRMVLADTLALAGREKPALMLDYATLTGACLRALSERYSGVFSNRPAALDVLTAAGRASGERVWPFPLDDDYDEDLKSTVADVLQCSPESDADHILAARFLQRFVPKGTPWIHMDMSAATRRKGLAHVPGGPTGFGGRWTLSLLLDHARELQGALAGAG
jgi:leucyl aminopeptidase